MSDVKKVVLAYSGGLDTSVILKWLQDTYGCEVVTFTADIGQGEEVEPARAKAVQLGIAPANIFIEDLREEFVRDFVYPMFRANAVYEGADAVMLSAESASGAYPVQAVSIMNRIISEVERDPLYPAMIEAQHQAPLPNKGDAISAAMRDAARIMGAKAMVAYTTSGHSSLRTARERPMAPIVSITPRLETARRLALAWGVHSTVSKDVSSVDEMVAAACRTAPRWTPPSWPGCCARCWARTSARTTCAGPPASTATSARCRPTAPGGSSWPVTTRTATRRPAGRA